LIDVNDNCGGANPSPFSWSPLTHNERLGGYQVSLVEERLPLVRFFEIVYKTAKRVSQERAINAIQSTSDVDDLGAFAGNDRSIGAGLHLPVHCS
jgi:hypothetical protein